MNLKVCGMKYKNNILEISNLKPDLMGFIFWPESPRYFDYNIINIPREIAKVGVFVNQSFEFILEKINKFDLNYVQLHGKEKVQFCKKLNSVTKIIKVFNVDEKFDFNNIKPFEDFCDYFLFDTKGKGYGGTGKKFNWNILKNYESNKPFFLSGGIGPEHVSKIKKLLKTNLPIYAIDINSKFETKPGLKKIEIIEDFKNKINEL